MASSPTQRSLKHLRKAKLHAYVVEHWNQWARIRQDFAGFADIIAYGQADGGYGIIAVQTTSYSNMSARRHKILASEPAREWVRSNGKIYLHGWKKLKNGRWELKEEQILFGDFVVYAANSKNKGLPEAQKTRSRTRRRDNLLDRGK